MRRRSGADEISTFVADLARARVGSTTNQCAIAQQNLDRPGFAATLEAHLRRGAGTRLMLVGQAPAYQVLATPASHSRERDHTPELRWSSTRIEGWKEPSATIVLRTLRELGVEDETVLRNSVATHPAGPTPLSKRPPIGRGLEDGHGWLLRVMALLSPIQVVAVGRSAARPCPASRRPASGTPALPHET